MINYQTEVNNISLTNQLGLILVIILLVGLA
jgi:hypothetical protein